MLNGLLLVLNHPCNRGHKLRAFFRILWWKCNQLFFRLPVVIQLTPEMKCICQPSSSYASLIVYTTWPEFAEMQYAYNNLQPRSTFIDIGAGLGEFTLIAASKITIGKIVAFEPTPLAYRQLLTNIALNNLEKQVKTVTAVVSDKNGKEKFDEASISEVSRISPTKVGQKNVLAITLDTFCKKEKIKRIELLKIDVEGAELKVLRGCKSLLAHGGIEKIIVELNPNCRQYGYTQYDTVEFLQENEYRIFTLTEDGTLLPFTISQRELDTINIIAIKNDKKNSHQHRIQKA